MLIDGTRNHPAINPQQCHSPKLVGVIGDKVIHLSAFELPTCNPNDLAFNTLKR